MYNVCLSFSNYSMVRHMKIGCDSLSLRIDCCRKVKNRKFQNYYNIFSFNLNDGIFISTTVSEARLYRFFLWHKLVDSGIDINVNARFNYSIYSAVSVQYSVYSIYGWPINQTRGENLFNFMFDRIHLFLINFPIRCSVWCTVKNLRIDLCIETMKRTWK